jgi:hypothetical protein
MAENSIGATMRKRLTHRSKRPRSFNRLKTKRVLPKRFSGFDAVQKAL